MEQEKYLNAAQSLRTLFDDTNKNLRLVRNVSELNLHKLDGDDEHSDAEDAEVKDPVVVASDVAALVSYLRKLKFQYLEQNAKDKYVKSIVSDIDDAPIVTDEDNKRLQLQNTERKERLKVAKMQLAEIQSNVRTLAPLVEQDYLRVKDATNHATDLAQKIIDARLVLSRLRQAHPHPRLTVKTADQRLADQVVEMQNLSDEIQQTTDKVHEMKRRVKDGALEVEGLRSKRTEVEKSVKAFRIDEDDGRLMPLYDWFTASLALHRSMQNLEDLKSDTENTLQLKYRIDPERVISFRLLFVPNTRNLHSVEIDGLEDTAADYGDIIEAHLQMNDVRGLVGALLARAREGI